MTSAASAKSRIIQIWNMWTGRTGGANDKSAFYLWLTQHHRPLLNFPCKGDRRQHVLLWLHGR
jgi:hypothetical protein